MKEVRLVANNGYQYKEWNAGDVITKNALNDMEHGIADVVLIQEQNPSNDPTVNNGKYNKLWINSNINTIEIPTYDEIESLNNNFAPQYVDLTFPISAGQFCLYDKNLYIANQEIIENEPWTIAHWTQIKIGNEIANIKNKIKTDVVSTLWDQVLSADNKQAARVNIGLPLIDWEASYTPAQRYIAQGNLGLTRIANAYDPKNTSYNVGVIVTYLGELYQCHTAISESSQGGGVGPFSYDTNWTYIPPEPQPLSYGRNQSLSESQKQQVRTNIGAFGIGNGVTPEQFGAIGDGVADDTNALLELVAYASSNNIPIILMPKKIYTTSRELQIYNPISIIGNDSIIRAITGCTGNVMYISAEQAEQFPALMDKCVISHFCVDCAKIANTGIALKTPKGCELRDIDVCNFNACGIATQDGFELFMDNVRVARTTHSDNTITYDANNPTIGIIMDTSDSRLSNIVTINCDIGISVHGSCNSFTNIHPWNANSIVIPHSIGIDAYKTITTNDCYIDTCAIGFNVADGTSVISTNLKILNAGPTIMNGIIPTVFTVNNINNINNIRSFGMVYYAPNGGKCNLFNMNISETDITYPWTINNDSSILNMQNVPITN